ncbi:MAG: hypothetical protein ACLUD0_13025 [Eubacterium ramulus]
MMRRRYFSALMFTAVLVFASPAGKTMASQVSENQTQSIAENVNVAVPSEAEKQVSGADDAITTVEEVFESGHITVQERRMEVMYIIHRSFQRMRIRTNICLRKSMWKVMIHTG